MQASGYNSRSAQQANKISIDKINQKTNPGINSNYGSILQSTFAIDRNQVNTGFTSESKFENQQHNYENSLMNSKLTQAASP